jgi:hypothetical protein
MGEKKMPEFNKGYIKLDDLDGFCISERSYGPLNPEKVRDQNFLKETPNNSNRKKVRLLIKKIFLKK